MLSIVILLFKLMFFTIWGGLKALVSVFSCCWSTKPDFRADICLITGAGQGLGRELALRFAATGATMVLWDVNQETLQAVEEEITKMGNEVFTGVVDCGNRNQVWKIIFIVQCCDYDKHSLFSGVSCS